MNLVTLINLSWLFDMISLLGISLVSTPPLGDVTVCRNEITLTDIKTKQIWWWDQL